MFVLKKKILSTFFQKVTWFPHDMAEKIIAFFVFCNIQTGLEYSTIFQLFGNRTVNTVNTVNTDILYI